MRTSTALGFLGIVILPLPALGGEGKAAERYLLWDPARPVPKAAEAPRIEGVRFGVANGRKSTDDGRTWGPVFSIARGGNRNSGELAVIPVENLAVE